MGQDRRRYPRAKVGLDVTLEAAGSQWEGKTVDLSPYGVKVTTLAESVNLLPGTSIQVWLSPGGQAPPLSLGATVIRTDSDGVALNFDGLPDQQFQRLKELVGSFLVREWKRMISQLQGGEPLDAGAGVSNEPLLEPQESSGTRGADSERDAWQAVLNRAGLDVQLPDTGSLSYPWLEFLKRLGADVESAGIDEMTQKVWRTQRKDPLEHQPTTTPENESTSSDQPGLAEVEGVVSESRPESPESESNASPTVSEQEPKRVGKGFLSYFVRRDRRQ